MRSRFETAHRTRGRNIELLVAERLLSIMSCGAYAVVARAGVLASICAHAGCFNPSLPADCALACDTGCPTGMECRSGLCVRADSRTSCAMTGDVAVESDASCDGDCVRGEGAGVRIAQDPNAGESSAAKGNGRAGGEGTANDGRTDVSAGAGMAEAERGGARGEGGQGGASAGEPEWGGAGVAEGGEGGVGVGEGGRAVHAGGAGGGGGVGAAEQGGLSVVPGWGREAGVLEGGAGDDDAADGRSGETRVTAGGGDADADRGGGMGSPHIIVPLVPETPCLGDSYRQKFRVEGGSPPYAWQVISLPRGLHFDDKTGVLSGVVEGSGDVALALKDGAGQPAEARYDIVPRESCWLAYVSRQSGVARLHLYDRIQRSEIGPLPRESIEAGPVTDFQFSPNGLALAYRMSGDRLVVAQAPSWAEHVLDLRGAADQYAWSPDSTVLAVGYHDDSGSYLGGVRMLVAADSSTSEGAIERLDPIPATARSGLTWFKGGQFVAFQPEPPTSRSIRYPHLAELGRTSFTSEIPLASFVPYGPTVELRASPSGFFAIDEALGVDFYSVPVHADEQFDVTSHSFGDAFVAPSGRYVVTVGLDACELQIFDTGDVSTRCEEFECHALLSWAAQRERIACAVNVDTGSELRIFDLDVPEPEPVAVGELPSYRAGDLDERRRLFSSSGAWFVVATDEDFYVAQLEGGQPRFTALAIPGAADGPVEMAFSPDERWLAVQRGGDLSLHALGSTFVAAISRQDDPLTPFPNCAESFWKHPSSWCGNPRNPEAQFAWSPDSRMIAFLTAKGTLYIVDPSGLPDVYERVDAGVSCGPGCLGPFAFQP